MEGDRLLEGGELAGGRHSRKISSKNYVRMLWCPACIRITDETFQLTSPHMLQICKAVTELRDTLGVKGYMHKALARSHSLLVLYRSRFILSLPSE